MTLSVSTGLTAGINSLTRVHRRYYRDWLRRDKPAGLICFRIACGVIINRDRLALMHVSLSTKLYVEIDNSCLPILSFVISGHRFRTPWARKADFVLIDNNPHNVEGWRRHQELLVGPSTSSSPFLRWEARLAEASGSGEGGAQK